MEYSIRKAKLEDLDNLLKFAIQQVIVTYINVYDSKDLNSYIEETYQKAKFQDYIQDENNFIIIAENISNKEIMGYHFVGQCFMKMEGINNNIDWEIKKLYIDKKYFGIGLGSVLLKDGLSWLKEKINHKKIENPNIKDNPKIWLNVWSRNIRAIKFYEKFNFKFFRSYFYVVGNNSTESEYLYLLEE